MTTDRTDETVRTFVEFFRDRGHQLLDGATLLPPPGDPVLFTTAGMHHLTPYLTGRPHPLGQRLVGTQRCLRTTDLDEVGDGTHLTVFEMLGSWSLGAYPGSQSLRWGYELLRDGFGIPPDRLHATVFGGDERVGPDTGSLDTWGELGVPVEQLGEDNWWSNGPTGPCGPDSEIFVWTGDGAPHGTPSTEPSWVEVWNHVMMRYRRHDDGSLEPLGESIVDTGMGLERMLMVLRGTRSVFECDLMEPWTRAVGTPWTVDDRSLRVLSDHLRSSVAMIGDGVRPSNTGRGYVLRRLLRRTLTTLWRGDPARSLADLPPEPIDDSLRRCRQPVGVGEVRDVMLDEQESFRRLLERGDRLVRRQRSLGPLTEDDFRYLHDTHGLPRELVTSLLSDLE